MAQHQRALCLVLFGVGIGVEVEGDVAGGGGIAANGHIVPRPWARRRCGRLATVLFTTARLVKDGRNYPWRGQESQRPGTAENRMPARPFTRRNRDSIHDCRRKTICPRLGRCPPPA